MAGTNNPQNTLTQENQFSRFALLNLAPVCGNLFRKSSVVLRQAETSSCLSGRQTNNLPPGCMPLPSAFHPLFHGRVFCRRNRATEGKNLPGSARYEHDKQRASTGGNPSSGHERPGWPCLVLSTPRNIQQNNPSGTVSNMEKQSWICACN